MSANEEVKHVVSQDPAKQRGPYVKFMAEQKAAIGKRAAEDGIAATIRYYTKQYPDLKESSVRTWKNTYTTEIKKRRRQGCEDLSVKRRYLRRREVVHYSWERSYKCKLEHI